MKKVLYLIRHGLIQSNVEQIYAGRNDEQLTESGTRRAQQLGREMRDWNVAAIYSSPVVRTLQTARLLNQHLNAELVIEPDLIEMDLGPWQGLSKQQVAEKFSAQYRVWYRKPAEFKLDGMETLQEVQQRVVKCIDKFRHNGSAQVAAAVTHAANIKCAILYYSHQSLDHYHEVDVPNLSVHRITLNAQETGVAKIK